MRAFILKNPKGRMLLWSIGRLATSVASKCDRWASKKYAASCEVVEVEIIEVERGNDMTEGEDNPYEPGKVIEAWGLDKNINLGNAIRYINRADKEDTNVEDLRKASWYLVREIKRLEGSPDPNQGQLFEKEAD